MQEVYQISVIPAYKPWRGFGIYYTTNKELFDLFDGQERWLPDMSVSEFPESVRHLAVEPTWDDEAECTRFYVPNGTENWDDYTAVVDGEEIELELSISNIFYNLGENEEEFPFVLLGAAQAYSE